MRVIFSGRILRRAVKAILSVSLLSMLVAAFCGVRPCAIAAKMQIVPAMVSGNLISIVLFAVLAAFWGRLYCEVVCPLGVIQDMLRKAVFRKNVRRVCSRLPESRRQAVVRWIVFALFMAAGLLGFSFMWLDPYGIFGRGVTLSGGLFFAVLALSFVGKGRFWCNWMCPVGTFLQLVSRVSVFKDRFDRCEHCGECRKCAVK